MQQTLEKQTKATTIQTVEIDKEIFFKISNSDQMRPFFMSIVSAYNHWMFIASNGGLTAGRKNSEFALFPYYTDDKITEEAEITGSKTIFQIDKLGEHYVWEPFSNRFEGRYAITRNLYKNKYGNKILFEEINEDLELTFRYEWSSSEKYGFVRTSTLKNNSHTLVNVALLDGIQNLLPYGVETDLQAVRSNLVDAYKRSELEPESALGIYALSAIIVDKAEPSEALRANVVWSMGLQNPTYLLSSLQVSNFRKGNPVTQEEDIKAEKGAYFLNAKIQLNIQEEKSWFLVADVNKSYSDIVAISHEIVSNKQLKELVQKDIDKGTKSLIAITASVDGLQSTEDTYKDSRHFANSLFNAMRGGLFDENYQIEKGDFSNYFQKANPIVYKNNQAFFEQLPEQFSAKKLKKLLSLEKDSGLQRLSREYLPLRFSRRHGDPSRPWNKFSINTQNEDGSKVLDYEGNWRDIFQNWEALLISYPLFVEGMIYKFLNATTFDGYNPYRVTKGGFDWEIIEPDDPWSYIGYWGDHQIIYLLKFLEFYEKLMPNALQDLFQKEVFVYANVPYKIKTYQEILKNSKDTIDFDEELDRKIRENRTEKGADGALLYTAKNQLIQVNFMEKILATTLAKISNFIPEAGIWMNTQRPEWNDANNALVGNGVSMVTLYYLRRFLAFFDNLLEGVTVNRLHVSEEMYEFFQKIVRGLDTHKDVLSTANISNQQRKEITDALGMAASAYRWKVYEQGFSGNKKPLEVQEIKSCIKLTLSYLEHSIHANQRKDGMFHAYNLMSVENDEIKVSYLDPMLEGQVAILSANLLHADETLRVLDALKNSALFRKDQYSYLLYPNKDLKGFLQKNNVPKTAVVASSLLSILVEDGNVAILEKDTKGKYHFNGHLRNAKDLEKALEMLPVKYQSFVKTNKQEVLDLYEKVFHHKAFTGRSGTFYGYEGLGSIYWHMVSKLLLAVQECCLSAINQKENKTVIGRLLEHYYEISAGIGIHKPPKLYGAFPTDPYSHTPFGKGAQQPGMTGQVKEDVLSRFGELGVAIKGGKLHFNPSMLRQTEFLQDNRTFRYVDVHGVFKKISLSKNMLAFTICQVPVLYQIGAEASIRVAYMLEATKVFQGETLDTKTSNQVFNRANKIEKIIVTINKEKLK